MRLIIVLAFILAACDPTWSGANPDELTCSRGIYGGTCASLDGKRLYRCVHDGARRRVTCVEIQPAPEYVPHE